jgi:DNA repair protein RadA/Sms
MAKSKTVYICQNCGAQSAKWVGRCPSCNEWNTYVEEVVNESKSARNWQPSKGAAYTATPRKIAEVKTTETTRLNSTDKELNRVLGGGIVPGSLVLIGGEPGIGKSTLLLQIALQLPKVKILYISGEESEQQIKMRAERLLGKRLDEYEEMYLLAETHTQSVFRHLEALHPDLLIVDSIQTLHTDTVESTAGSITQLRECTGELMKYAKQTNTPCFIIGHVNKEGSIAGPKVLEHMVDTVLMFEGDRHMTYRILRTVKNRFGSTAELGIYEMQNSGLRQVTNPSEILLSQNKVELNGVAVGATMEGNRPLLIEVQSLVSSAAYGTPQRSSTGYDSKRLNMLLAVLEKRCGFRLANQDVFLNITGGLKIEDPAIDLAVCASIVSSYVDQPIPENVCFAGEIGLGGEVRGVSKIENRVMESIKLGFQEIYISEINKKGLNLSEIDVKVNFFNRLEDIFKGLLNISG